MSKVNLYPLPQESFLQPYREKGAYVDCYSTTTAAHITTAEFIEAFYTTPLFKLERLILKWLVSRPSTDLQARQLARGEASRFAAWRVEERSEEQLLMCDFQGKTRSWLMTGRLSTEPGAGTRLYFGSAVVPSENPETGETRMGPGFQALLGFHKLYSRALLHSARSELEIR